MPFTKTDWIEGSAPGISAAELDRMEDGIVRSIELFNAGDPIQGSGIVMGTTRFLELIDQQIVTTNAAGDFGVTFLAEFPNGLLHIVCQPLDPEPPFVVMVYSDPALTNRQFFNGRIYNLGGGAFGEGNDARLTYRAIGW